MKGFALTSRKIGKVPGFSAHRVSHLPEQAVRVRTALIYDAIRERVLCEERLFLRLYYPIRYTHLCVLDPAIQSCIRWETRHYMRRSRHWSLEYLARTLGLFSAVLFSSPLPVAITMGASLLYRTSASSMILASTALTLENWHHRISGSAPFADSLH
ncbi:uncharacterized protein CC84DRAFT_385240 [Paraphaeosphaeria sporulosa]|uniref:Uncharacterized protein n=1 Tax=Paraphaeosphaeria sporulosa TaxID=1460663 RepID=A0A177BXR3_9PLEO|nr:uncharacterized protein CC84DRAFT_385240 [Paraphaeosphaeria sporulosa]OAF99186.1 hypothetical protein CC84DRAFT_385240 [Paraphaeosphaeria sporulosa]